MDKSILIHKKVNMTFRIYPWLPSQGLASINIFSVNISDETFTVNST